MTELKQRLISENDGLQSPEIKQVIHNQNASQLSIPESNTSLGSDFSAGSSVKSRTISLNSWHHVPRVSLTWQNLGYTAKPGTKREREILFDISGFIPQGKILAIIGPSGAGKTTLLRILSGCLVATKGEIRYNGSIKPNTVSSALNDDIMGYSGNAAFITQELLLHGSLTVRETLYYAAQLKCHGMNKKSLNERIDKLLDYLGLIHCQNTLIGNLFFKGISGGEKRRCAIGCELVTQLSLIFADEPTSGLDATSAYTLFTMCHGLTMLGHSIIMTIHQFRLVLLFLFFTCFRVSLFSFFVLFCCMRTLCVLCDGCVLFYLYYCNQVFGKHTHAKQM